MISHKHKAVFVHVPKTAGTSVEHAFLRDLGLKWSERRALAMGPNRDPALGPPRLAHLTAQDYFTKGYLSRETFDEYLTFAFVRNPWARIVSFYRYLGIGGDFKRFVCSSLPKTMMKRDHFFVRPQYEFLCDESGEIVVEFVGRFETLAADFAVVATRLGLPPALPHENALPNNLRSRLPSVRARARQLRNGLAEGDFGHAYAALRPKRPLSKTEPLFDEESIGIVRELYGRDMALFGYPEAPEERRPPQAGSR